MLNFLDRNGYIHNFHWSRSAESFEIFHWGSLYYVQYTEYTTCLRRFQNLDEKNDENRKLPEKKMFILNFVFLVQNILEKYQIPYLTSKYFQKHYQISYFSSKIFQKQSKPT